jgi:NADPH:quinone reductase-like Zn-dependent oxidoreductase
MRAYEIATGSTSLDSLRLVERPDPVAGAGQVLVRLHAASLNYRDQAVVTGRYFGGVVSRDVIPLSDGAGEVVSVGAGVTALRAGDRVAGTFFLGWIDGPPARPYPARGVPADGMLAEYAVVDAHDAVRIPANLSYEEAATLPCAAVTAWHALVETAEVRPGDTVLTLGTGGVSTFAIAFARAAGARVIVTSSSDDKLERAAGLGAAHGINYARDADWPAKVLEITSGAGAKHVIETGGPGTLAKSMQAVGYDGHIALIGVLAGLEGDTNPHPLMLKGAHLHGIFVGNRAMFERMNAAIEANDLKPVIDRVFRFEEAVDAYRYQQTAALFGKVVIRID